MTEITDENAGFGALRNCPACLHLWAVHDKHKGCNNRPGVTAYLLLLTRVEKLAAALDEAIRRAASAELLLQGKVSGEYRSRASELDAAALTAVRAGIDRRCDIARAIHARDDATDRALKRLIHCGLVTRTFIGKGATRYTARAATETKKEAS